MWQLQTMATLVQHKMFLSGYNFTKLVGFKWANLQLRQVSLLLSSFSPNLPFSSNMSEQFTVWEMSFQLWEVYSARWLWLVLFSLKYSATIWCYQVWSGSFTISSQGLNQKSKKRKTKRKAKRRKTLKTLVMLTRILAEMIETIMMRIMTMSWRQLFNITQIKSLRWS